MKKMKLSLLSLLALALLINCSNESNLESTKNFEVTFEEIEPIKGDVGSINNEIIYPRYVQLDSSGNIYVYDNQHTTILKLDSQGNYIKRIGSAGRGPGEFEDVSFFKIYNDSLYTFSRGTKLFQVFDTEGNLKDSKSLNINGFFDMVPSQDGYTLIFNESNIRNLGDFPIIGTYDFNFDPMSPKTVSQSRIYPSHYSDELENYMPFRVGKVLVLNEKQLLLSPDLYHGKIYEFTYNENEKNWFISDSLVSEPVEKLYEEVNENESYEMSTLSVKRGERAFVNYLSQSYGLAKLSDGKFCALVLSENDENIELRAHIFNESYKYLGNTKLIDGSIFPDERMISIYETLTEKDGVFYRVGFNFETEEVYLSGNKLNLNFD